jgi:hypothetical protein
MAESADEQAPGASSDADDDEAASDPSDSWTNEHVREGYDVDGSESRTAPMRMETRLALNRMGTAVLGPVLWWVLAYVYRPSYSLLRAVGDALGKGGDVEQYVAEKEYVATTVRNGEDAGIGSREWFGGLALVGGLVLLGSGGGYVVGTAVAAPAGTAPGEVLPGLVLTGVGLALQAGAVALAAR